ncbi:MAG: hypothetical protein LC624_11795, partial [Halobacteriales archaeon]|nr:hypothetical protein [Halobacteriales archaeon]
GVPVPDPMGDGIAIPTDQARQLLTDTGAFGAASIRGVALVANVASDGLGSIASTKLAEAGAVRDAGLDLSTAGVAMGAGVAVASQASTCTSVGALARTDACQAGSMGGVAIVQQAQLQAQALGAQQATLDHASAAAAGDAALLTRAFGLS